MGTPFEVVIIDAAKAARQFEWGEVVGNRKVFACHKAQLDILQSSTKFTFAFAGTGGGKTCLIPLWLFKRIQAKPNGRFLVVSPSAPIFESSQLKQHITRTFEGTALEGEWKQKNYVLPTGGEIIVKTVGDGGDWQRLVGGQYDGVVADECFFLSVEVWNEMKRRGGQKDTPYLCVSTPNGNNWIYEAKKEAEQSNPEYYVRHWGSADNPTYSKEHLERERKVMSKAAFARMYEGQFSAMEGLVFASFGDPSADDYPVIDTDTLPSKPVKFFGGNDWGYNPDPAAELMIAQCEDGCFYVCDEIYGKDITPDDMASKALKLIDKWAVHVDSRYAEFGPTFSTFWSDVSRPEAATMFRRAGVPIRNKRVADILAGLAHVDSWFRSGRLKVLGKNCPNLVRELRVYQWESDRIGDLKDRPRDKDNHAVDALRYAVSSQLYGITPTPLEVEVKADESAERKKLQSYGIEPHAIDEGMKELEELRAKERFIEAAYGNDQSDDPFGIWQSF
jgi:hypothetical protein